MFLSVKDLCEKMRSAKTLNSKLKTGNDVIYQKL